MQVRTASAHLNDYSLPVSTGHVVAACSGLDACDNKCGEPVKEYSFGIRLG